MTGAARQHTAAACKRAHAQPQVIHEIADGYKYGVVRDFVGHGVGRVFHSDPHIQHVRNNDARPMKLWQTFTIEPMLVQVRACGAQVGAGRSHRCPIVMWVDVCDARARMIDCARARPCPNAGQHQDQDVEGRLDGRDVRQRAGGAVRAHAAHHAQRRRDPHKGLSEGERER